MKTNQLNYSLTVAAIAVLMIAAGCAKEQVQGEAATDTPLTVHVAGTEESSPSKASYTGTTFKTGDELGLYATEGTLSKTYNGLAANNNVKSVLSAGAKWVCTPIIYLSSRNCKVFAYFPYRSTMTTPAAMPVEHTTQTDYMCGTHTTTVNNGQTNVALTMKHALSLLQFKFDKLDYTDKGEVTKITVRNATGKTALVSAGTLNIETGVLTKTTGQNTEAKIEGTPVIVIPQTASSDENTYPKILTLPAAAPALGDIEIGFTVDGKEYIYKLPAGTDWKAGYKHTYSITMEGTELIVTNVSITQYILGTGGGGTLK